MGKLKNLFRLKPRSSRRSPPGGASSSTPALPLAARRPDSFEPPGAAHQSTISPPEAADPAPPAAARHPSPSPPTQAPQNSQTPSSSTIPPLPPPAGVLSTSHPSNQRLILAPVTGAGADPATSDPSAAGSTLSLNHAHAPSILVNGTSTDPSLWEQAYNRLAASDQAALPTLRPDDEEFIGDIIKATNKSRDHCQEKALKFKFGEKEIVVRDLADKIITCIDKFKAVGDTVIQFDPVHGALPWAAVRFFLQMAVNHKEIMDSVLLGMEQVTRLTTRCAIYEKMYLGAASPLSVAPNLRQALVSLYHSILQFLIFAKRHFEKHFHGKVVSGLLGNEGMTRFDAIGIAESQLMMEITAAGGEDHTLQKTLQWLSEDRYHENHMNAQVDILQETGQWLFEREAYREWRSLSASGIVWLRGNPGAGKTKLTCQVITTLLTQPNGKEPVVFFYFNRNDPNRMDSTILMRTLVKQLCLVPHKSGFPKEVLERYQERERRGATNEHLRFNECSELIVPLLDTCPQTTIIIDGLDECELRQRKALLKTLSEVIRSSTSLVKIFISSREEIDIKMELQHVPNVFIDAYDNQYDIQRFVNREIWERERLLNGGASERLKTMVTSKIVGKANGMFQWAYLQIEDLSRMRVESDIEHSLDKLPATLEKAYESTWSSIMDCPPGEQLLAQRAFALVRCSYVPLSSSEWAEGCYSPDDPPKNGVETLLDLCRNLVVWNEQLKRMAFSHLSVNEYLEKADPDSITAHSILALSCLCFLMGQSKLLIGGGSHTDSWFRSAWSAYPSLGKETFYRYACLRFPSHVECAVSKPSPMREGVLKLLEGFLGVAGNPGTGYCTWLDSINKGVAKPRGSFWGHFNVSVSAWGWMRSTAALLYSEPFNPLFALCRFNFGQEILLRWLAAASVDSCNGHGYSLLLIAAAAGNMAVVEILLGNGADVNPLTRSLYQKPLVAAVVNGHMGIAERLVHLGALRSTTYSSMLEAVAGIGDAKGVRWALARESNNRKSAETRPGGSGAPPGKDPSGSVVTKAVMIAAVRNSTYARDIIAELLKHMDGKIEITEGIMAASSEEKEGSAPGRHVNYYMERDRWDFVPPTLPSVAIQLAKHLVGANAKVTEAMLLAALKTRKSERLKVIKSLLPIADSSVTEAVLMEAARNLDYDCVELMALFLGAPNSNTGVTGPLLIAAAGEGSVDMMAFLLGRLEANDGADIPEGLLFAAASNCHRGGGVLGVLLKHPVVVTQMTQAVPAAAIAGANRGGHSAAKALHPMLNLLGAKLQVTDVVLKQAISNKAVDSDGVELLLKQAKPKIEITEEMILMVIARLEPYRSREFPLLWRSYGPREPHKPWGRGVEILALLLEYQTGDIVIDTGAIAKDIYITAAVMSALVAHTRAPEIIPLLFKRLPTVKILITEDVVKSAARNRDLFQFFEELGMNAHVPEAAIAAITRSLSTRGMVALLEQRGKDPKITEALLIGAVSGYRRLEKTTFLLKTAGQNVDITEAVLVAATGSSSPDARDVISLLLESGGAAVITEAVLVAAASNESDAAEGILPLLLNEVNPNAKTTEAPQSLLTMSQSESRRPPARPVQAQSLVPTDADFEITEPIFLAALGNKANAEGLTALLLKYSTRKPNITTAILLAALDIPSRKPPAGPHTHQTLPATSAAELLLSTPSDDLEIANIVLLAAVERKDWFLLELLLRKCARIEIRESIFCEMSQHPLMTPLMLDLLRQKAHITEAIDEYRDIATGSTGPVLLDITQASATAQE